MRHIAHADSGAAVSAAAFSEVLQAEHDALGAFIGLLQAEQDALVRGDADHLAVLSPDKAVHIDLLTRLGEQRKRHFAEQKLTDSASGMSTWLSRNRGLAAKVGTIWRELLVRAEKAQQLNQTNGVLIGSHLQQNRQKLAVLQTAAAADGIYRADGQLRPLRSARSISQV
jgi:flagella synthesis protein FlgN